MNNKTARKLRKESGYHPTKSKREVKYDKFGCLINDKDTDRYKYQELKKVVKK